MERWSKVGLSCCSGELAESMVVTEPKLTLLMTLLPGVVVFEVFAEARFSAELLFERFEDPDVKRYLVVS